VHRIDAAQARLVADAHLAARRESNDAVVRAAYAELAAQADRWFGLLTDRSRRYPIDVVHTGCPEPYDSGEQLRDGVRSTRVLELCPTRFDRDRRHPLFDTSIGGSYDRFRAVHDIVSHASLGFGFDRHGEYSAWLAERSMYSGLARWALATELHGEHSVLWTTGTIADHKATLLPLDVLRASATPPNGR
jgi:hypothetical protein